MRPLLLFFLFFASATNVHSQTSGSYCIDPLKIVDITYRCYEDYLPVCGCDGITYRTECAAENQYALFDNSWTFGPCTNFDYDISPNQAVDFLQLKMFKKIPGYFIVTIYDSYGHIYFTQVYNYPTLNSLTYERYEIGVTGFEQGLYIIEIISDGEQQIKKFFKVNLE